MELKHWLFPYKLLNSKLATNFEHVLGVKTLNKTETQTAFSRALLAYPPVSSIVSLCYEKR